MAGQSKAANHHNSDWWQRQKRVEYDRERGIARAAKEKEQRAAAKAARIAEKEKEKATSQRPRAAKTARTDEAEIEVMRLKAELLAAQQVAAESLQREAALQQEKAELKQRADRAAAARARRAEDGSSAPSHVEELYAAFDVGADGLPRSKAAAERAAQRAVKAVADPIAGLTEEQRPAVLRAALKRPGVREAAAEAGIGDASLGQRVLSRVKDAVASMGVKKGSLPADVEAALDTFHNLAVPAPAEGALQRGKDAKRQKASGGEVQPAAVTGVREWADAIGVSISTAWRRMKGAVERRAKLDEGEDEAYWTYYRERIGRGLSDETRLLVYDFYVEHPSVKRSPMLSDVIRMRDRWGNLVYGDDGKPMTVARLLSEASLTDVYLDFEKKHPGLLKERAFRDLRPPELRRMSRRHLDMCGCRYCVEMGLMQDAFNKSQLEIAAVDASFKPPYTHAKPSMAAADATCSVCDDGFPKLECAASRMRLGAVRSACVVMHACMIISLRYHSLPTYRYRNPDHFPRAA